VSAPPDRWLVLRVPVAPDPDLRALLVEALLELPCRGVEERDEALVVYLPPPDEDEHIVADEMERHLQALTGHDGLRIEVDWQAHEAWEEHWRRGLRPRRVTSRLVVAPSWVRVEPEPGDLILALDPGLAFGTAEHPTTRGCLRLLDGRVEAGARVADVGAGSGILSVAAALMGAETVLALELDPWACAVARENAAANGVADRVEVRAVAVGPDFLPGEPPFDGVMANIETGILLPLLDGFHAGLRADGWLILSGIPEAEAGEVLRAARSQGFSVEEEDREASWWSAAFRCADAGTAPDGAPEGTGAEGSFPGSV
jgi:ribosomal protein L11 methyltransferase